MALKEQRRAAGASPPDLTARLAAATALHGKGDAAGAEPIYREVLAAEPNQPDALHNLGVICAQSGRSDEALTLIERALERKPDYAVAHNSLAILLRRLGRAEKAVAHYERAIALDPSYADARGNLGVALRVLGRVDEAVAHLEEAARLKPGSAEIRLNLGAAYKDAGRLDEAIDAYREGIRLNPDRAESHAGLGVVLRLSGRPAEALAAYDRALALKPNLIDAALGRARSLADAGRKNDSIAAYRAAVALDPAHVQTRFSFGGTLQAIGDLDGAIAEYRRALELQPDYAEILVNLGNAYKDKGELDEALRCYRRALEIKPDFTEVLCNLGIALKEADRLDEAEAVIDRAIALSPGFALSHANLGVLRHAQGRQSESIACYRRAIELDPNCVDAYQNLCAAMIAEGRLDLALDYGRRAVAIDPKHHGGQFNLSHALLLAGDFAAGFDAYEHRPSHAEAKQRLKIAPLWDRAAPKGSTVLVYVEQGLGDAVQFVRYVPMLQALGHHVVLEARPPLRRLFAQLDGVTLIERKAAPPPVDFQISLLSLPRAFGTRLDSVPADIPYLEADEAAASRFRARLEGAERKVGLVWRGNPHHKNDRHRSLDPALLAPLFQVPNARLVSLQKPASEDELASLRGFGPIEDWTGELGDFADTAALIEALDLVVAADTSVAHVAGALGKPVWILLPFAPDWRWMMAREDTPWYPTAKLFRQPAIDDWESVVSRVAKEMASPSKPMTIQRVSSKKRATTGSLAKPSMSASGPPTAAAAALSEPLAARFAQGLAHQRAGRLAEAAASYEAVLEKAPDHAPALVNLGMIRLNQSDKVQALELTVRALARDPNNADAHNMRGALHERAGELEDAARCFARATELRPNAPDLHHNLGIVARRLGHRDKAIAACERALALKPDSIGALNTLASTLKDARRYDEALKALDRAIALDPKAANNHMTRGNVLHAKGRYEDAVAAYRAALELRPDYPEAQGNLGIALKELKRFDEAAAALARAIELRPKSPELLMNYGNVLKANERDEESVAQYEKALALKPDYAECWNNLGIAFAALSRNEKAREAYDKAIALRGDYPEAINNLANLLKAEGRVAEADAAYARALAIRPSFVQAELNRANLSYDAGRYEEAIESYRTILAKAPDLADGHFNLGLTLLTLGRFEEGLDEHEWRWKRPGVKPNKFRQPLWHPGAPAGSRVLIHAEQGFGDTIQFARYVPKVAAFDQKVKIGVPKALRPLLSLLPDVEVVEVIPNQKSIDYQVSFLSLPRAFGTRLDTIPADVPYLPVPEAARQGFAARLPADRLNVGLVWRGNPKHKNDHNRSVEPARLAPLFEIAGVRMISLQKEPRAGDLDVLRGFGEIEDWTDTLKSFADTAALVSTLDLVIGVDTSVIHLAGALATPFFLLLPHVPDWRWLLDREDSPWYPTGRLFRQPKIGEWDSVMERLAAALADTASRPRGG